MIPSSRISHQRNVQSLWSFQRPMFAWIALDVALKTVGSEIGASIVVPTAGVNGGYIEGNQRSDERKTKAQ